MSHPWEDPIANAIIELAAAFKQIAAALQTIGDAWMKEAEHEIAKDTPYTDDHDIG